MAVLPNGSGRRMTGVVSLSGAVRSMTWMPPSLIAVVRSVSRDMAGAPVSGLGDGGGWHAAAAQ